jgi:hypothetical protein
MTAESMTSICLLCTAIMVDTIVAKTEGHISLFLNTRAKEWKNITLDKMKVLVASLINMNLTFNIRSAPIGPVVSIVIVAKVPKFGQSCI